MDYRERITIEPDKLDGKLCIRGLRITVYDPRLPGVGSVPGGDPP
jgi:hypothetical protein